MGAVRPPRPCARLLLPALVALLVLAPAAAAQPAVAPPGSTVAGIDISGMDEPTALAVVREAFARPVQLQVGAYRFRVTPQEVQATAQIKAAVETALARPAGGNTPVEVTYPTTGLRRAVDRVVGRASHRALPPRWRLTRTKPLLLHGRPGKAPSRKAVERQIVRALQQPLLRAEQPKVPLEPVRIKPTLAALGYVVVVSKPDRTLKVYAPWRGKAGVVRWFRVAVGAPSFPTPAGIFHIAEKQVDPWWNPPDAPWAAGASPVPPGPSNPLGTRWMGLDRDGIGIHGTPDSGSIGGYASHGCIRMLIHSAEQLFGLVPVGTPVIIY